jgi:hypothetical protein
MTILLGVQPMSSQPGVRMCVACGRTLPWDANVCPYCGHDYRYAAQHGKPEEISDGLKIVFYILSFLFWIVGLVIGLIYYSKPDPESKHVGKMCLLFAALSVAVTVGLSFILWVTLLSWA